MDAIDQMILRKLAIYESLDLLELWYEIGEDDMLKESVTKEEISNRLESLKAQGLVEEEKLSDDRMNLQALRVIRK